MISFQPTENLSASAEITYDNMRSYYQHYSVDWEPSQIQELIAELENWDILYNGEVVGAVRLAFEEEACWLRDLQVSEPFQNKGIGAAAIEQVMQFALNAGKQQLSLRVFKISPAYQLYKRMGFVTDKRDDRFYYMSKSIAH